MIVNKLIKKYLAMQSLGNFVIKRVLLICALLATVSDVVWSQQNDSSSRLDVKDGIFIQMVSG